MMTKARNIQAGQTYSFEADDRGGHTRVKVSQVTVEADDVSVEGEWSGGGVPAFGWGCFDPDDNVQLVVEEGA